MLLLPLLPLLLLPTCHCRCFRHARLCSSPLPGRARLAFICARSGLFVLIRLSFSNLTPFAALGFDLLAEKVYFDGKYTLKDVASLKYRLLYGCLL